MVKNTTKTPAKKAPVKKAAAAKAPATIEYTEDMLTADVQPIVDVQSAGADGVALAADDPNVNLWKHFGHVEVSGFPNADGTVQVRISEAGAAWIAENVDLGDSDEGEGVKADTIAGDFAIDTDVPFPTGKRGGMDRVSKYPFDLLPLHGSFHIPKTEANPKPNLSMASAVTSANNRWKDKPEPRKFITRSVGSDDKNGAGVRIFRAQ